MPCMKKFLADNELDLFQLIVVRGEPENGVIAGAARPKSSICVIKPMLVCK